jgi:hypothetical protein
MMKTPIELALALIACVAAVLVVDPDQVEAACSAGGGC